MRSQAKVFSLVLASCALAIGLALLIHFVPKLPSPISPLPTSSAFTPLSQGSCQQVGGHWNACGSACPNAPTGTACIDVCVPRCECTSDATCQSGYTCLGSSIEPSGLIQPGICQAVQKK